MTKSDLLFSVLEKICCICVLSLFICFVHHNHCLSLIFVKLLFSLIYRCVILAYVKTQKHSLQNKFKIWNIDEKKYQKMKISKILYFALVNFNLLLFTLWPAFLFHDQFTESLHHCLHPVLVKCEVSLDCKSSEEIQCYKRK